MGNKELIRSLLSALEQGHGEAETRKFESYIGFVKPTIRYLF